MAVEIIERLIETEEVQIELPAPKRNVCWFLMEVRALIAKPGSWIQGKFHRKVHGGSWGNEDEAYCVSGAFQRVMNITGVFLQDEAQRLFARGAGIAVDRIVMWNDSMNRTHDEVLAAFDAAIALAEREAACEP